MVREYVVVCLHTHLKHRVGVTVPVPDVAPAHLDKIIETLNRMLGYMTRCDGTQWTSVRHNSPILIITLLIVLHYLERPSQNADTMCDNDNVCLLAKNELLHTLTVVMYQLPDLLEHIDTIVYS